MINTVRQNELAVYNQNDKLTSTTAEELAQMADADFLAHLRRFPYESLWKDAKAYADAQCRLATCVEVQEILF